MSRGAIYLAGPSGFTEPGRRWHHDVLVPAVLTAGFDVLDPWDDDAPTTVDLLAALDLPPGPDRLRALAEADHAVARHNVGLLERATALLALLDGSDVDSGTAAEIGWAAARAVPVVGLRTDVRPAGDNEGTIVNLQVAGFITGGAGSIVASLDEAIEALLQLSNWPGVSPGNDPA